MNLAQALLHFKGDEPPKCTFSITPTFLIDKDYCDQLAARIFGYFGGHWEQRIACGSLGCMLPDLPGIYMFVWNTHYKFLFEHKTESMKFIVYIGQAGDGDSRGTIKSRYNNEYARIVKCNAESIWNISDCDQLRSSLLHRYLNLDELEYWYLVSDKENTDRLKIIEKKLIKLFCPPANRQKGISGKLSKPVAAFE